MTVKVRGIAVREPRSGCLRSGRVIIDSCVAMGPSAALR